MRRDLSAELADPTTSAQRLLEIETELHDLTFRKLQARYGSRLYCALARHPNLPAKRLHIFLNMHPAPGFEQRLDYAAVRAAAAENPSLHLCRVTGELPL